MRTRDRRSWLQNCLLCLALGAVDAIAADTVQERAPASAPTDGAAKAAIFELIDTAVARRDLSDLELLERTLRTDRKGSGFMVASSGRKSLASSTRKFTPDAVAPDVARLFPGT